MRKYILDLAKEIKTASDFNYSIELIIKEFNLTDDVDTYYRLMDILEFYK